ncbi:MAG TPA: glycosyltransferase [Gemmatimonadales bacterium]|nr:glycosyltransferase [Gemmatimonadales bacterium]
MRLLWVAHSFPRVEGDIAGAFLWRLAEALSDRGHEVTVLAPADRGDMGEPKLGRVEVRRLRYASPRLETIAYQGTMHELSASPLGAWAFAALVRTFRREISRCLATGRYHLVHAHWWVPGGLAAVRAERHGRPAVITLHGTDMRLARAVPGGRMAMRWVLRRAALTTAVSSYLSAEAATVLRTTRDRVPVTPMPLALGITGDPDSARHGALFVGRLTRQKGVHDLLEALSILKRQGLSVDLTIVGDGPERANLKAQAIAAALPVVFAGYVPPDEVGRHFVGKRLFCLPAYEEGLGLVVAEALTQGVPVVATRSGGIPDLMMDPEAGLLVPPGDPRSLAAAIRTVLMEDRFRIGAVRTGRILAERLSPEAVAERFEGYYLRARGARSSSAKL